MAAAINPFQLLEINIISAQDLQLHSKKMRSYATAWVHSNRKLTTVTDTQGGNNPTWNDKFVFRIDEEFLRRDTSAVMIEIYSVGWWKNTLIGTVRVLIGNLFPPQSAAKRHQAQRGMRFVALQVRRPSGRPQGILNIGITVLDPSKRSMPLYNHLAASSAASAVGFRDLMEENGSRDWNQKGGSFLPPPVEPVLRRSKSERSDWIPNDNDGSIISIMTKEDMFGQLDFSSSPWQGKKKGKSSSVINGAELTDKPKEKGPKKKSSSVINVPTLFTRKESPTEPKPEPRENVTKLIKSSPKPVPGKAVAKFSLGGPKGTSLVHGLAPKKANSIWSDSEVGPSPSEVAAVMATRQRRYNPLDDDKSSMMDGWSMDESEEGLRSKMERWRTELPPLYDRSFTESSYQSSSQRRRSEKDVNGGAFSCFGNVCGYECKIVCGKPPEEEGKTRNERNQSPYRNAGQYESPYGNAGRYESPQGNAGRYKSPQGNAGRYESPQGKQGRSGGRHRSPYGNVGRSANRYRRSP